MVHFLPVFKKRNGSLPSFWLRKKHGLLSTVHKAQDCFAFSLLVYEVEWFVAHLLVKEEEWFTTHKHMLIKHDEWFTFRLLVRKRSMPTCWLRKKKDSLTHRLVK